jgi:hypothetical protein
LKDIDKQFSEAEWKAKAAELLSTLADVKLALVVAQQQAYDQELEIKRLRNAFQVSQDAIVINDWKYEKNAQGSPIGVAPPVGSGATTAWG